MNDEIKRLEAVELDAKRAESAIDQERRDFVSARHRTVEIEANERFGAKLQAVREARFAASQAVLEAREAAALRGEGAPLPLGTRVCKWVTPYARWSSRPLGPDELKATGVIEAITRESEHPANLEYGRADVGQFVIRLHKKDGTLGARYEKLSFNGELPHGWKAESGCPCGEP